MGYVGLVVGALVVTMIVPKAAAEAYRRAKARLDRAGAEDGIKLGQRPR